MPNTLPTTFCKGVRNEMVYFLWGGIRYNSPDNIEKLLAAKKQQNAVA